MPILKLGGLVDVIIEEMTAKYDFTSSVQVEEIGLHSGEKRYEELMTDDEALTALEAKGMYISLFFSEIVSIQM